MIRQFFNTDIECKIYLIAEAESAIVMIKTLGIRNYYSSLIYFKKLLKNLRNY
jgi:hypothetical protein